MTTNALLITASGNWTVPAGVTLVKVARMVGGGAAGGCTRTSNTGGAGGAGAGEFLENVSVNVTPGEIIPVTIGAAGVPYGVNGAPNTTDNPQVGSPQNGGVTSFKYLNCQGGFGGTSTDVVQYSSGRCANGGGTRGGHYPINNPNGQSAVQGTAESNTHFGGASGGSLTIAFPGTVGGYCNGYRGGSIANELGSGGGGASTPFGSGAAGGVGQPSAVFPGPCNASATPVGSYGAAGAGAGWYGGAGWNGAVGSTGVAGAVLLTWMS